MTTSGSGLVFTVSFVAVVAAAALCVGPRLAGRVSLRRVPRSGWVLWLVVALPSLLQIPFPWIYDALYRNASAALQGHQWWRVATALVVQDGGIAGTLSNLVLLAIALLACLPLWGARVTVLAFVLVGVSLNIAAVLLGAQDGGGNSGATLALIASLPPLALAISRNRRRPVIALAVTIASAVALLATNDGHGYAILAGLLVGVGGMSYARGRLQRGLIPPESDAT